MSFTAHKKCVHVMSLIFSYLSRLYYTPHDLLQEYNAFECHAVSQSSSLFFFISATPIYCSTKFWETLYGIKKDTLCRYAYYQESTVSLIINFPAISVLLQSDFFHLLSRVLNSLLSVIFNHCPEIQKINKNKTKKTPKIKITLCVKVFSALIALLNFECCCC